MGEGVKVALTHFEQVGVSEPVGVYGWVVGIGETLNVYEGDSVALTHFE